MIELFLIIYMAVVFALPVVALLVALQLIFDLFSALNKNK